MSTSHLCSGKWKPGPVSECPKHTRLSKKQTSVFRSGGDSDAPKSPAASGSGGSGTGSD